MIVQRPTPNDTKSAETRRAAFLAAIPPSVLYAEDKLPSVVRAMNASSRSKLHRIYQVAENIAKAREPFVACGKGCASCCHMNVSLTKAEAERLGAAISRNPAALSCSISHSLEEFAGSPCPFLDGEAGCSVYAHRPLACRKHASFFQNAAPCHPSVMNDLKVPSVRFSGLDEALFAVGDADAAILADIRDFFPRKA